MVADAVCVYELLNASILAGALLWLMPSGCIIVRKLFAKLFDFAGV